MWVFGYGSLVSPVSFARTIGRVIDDDANRKRAELSGYGRRWNYGSPGPPAEWRDQGRVVRAAVVIYLGLEKNTTDSCNGVVVNLSEDEIEKVDKRERDYDRVDVTSLVSVKGGPVADPIVTYVPRPAAIERYLVARTDGRAAVDRSYWDLVHDGFAQLGVRELDRFTTSTPAPDVSIVDVLR